MKNIKLISIISLLISIIIIPIHVFAQEHKSFTIESISNSDYELSFGILNNLPGADDYDACTGKELNRYIFRGGKAYKDGVIVYGQYEWENPDYVIKDGEQTVTMLFKSDSGEIVKAELVLYGVKWENPYADGPSEPTTDPATVEEQPTITKPSLTASSIALDKSSTYDININDKVSGTYAWTSSNPKVAKVNSKNGFVTAVSDGTAKITCKITASDGQVYTLVSTVTVGVDDNLPILTDDVIDLNAGNQYDLGVENQIAGSKYRYRSSNRSIATVNVANGIITAKGVGKANVYCTITTPDKQVIVLKCEVNVNK
ncbi:hypothetical protein Ana3638_11940 [Anaerocolumna sedimenticola]|uniref:BIG2 domain-containing protein n=1 Tax=Anaerocolumna sedimenticola TaxID=2696063 RepID=A0A6P1TNL0_9FIRM|nr:Ig-like domain-containing protein [Anaerocolumna sedimenticola]QHQ61396.1 hypothetical protein Ana3638_11940 [Anaerocolumna sedimenticola]